MKTFLKLFFLLFAIYSYSQIPDISSGKPEDFKELKNKKLIVLLYEENPKLVKQLDKPKTQKNLEDYRAFIKQHNAVFVDYVKKYWKFNNGKFEIKKDSEIKALIEDKNAETDYALLGFRTLSDTDSDFSFEISNKSDLGVGALFFGAVEKKKGFVKCYINGYNKSFSKLSAIEEEDYKFGLETLQSTVDYFIQTNKVINFRKFGYNMSENNCSKLKSKTLLVDKNALMEGRSAAKAKENYNGDINFVSIDEIRSAFVNKEKGKAVLLAYPYGTIKGSFGPISSARLVYLKVILDCESGEILYLYMPGGLSYGANLAKEMTEGEFKTIGKCDKP